AQLGPQREHLLAQAGELAADLAPGSVGPSRDPAGGIVGAGRLVERGREPIAEPLEFGRDQLGRARERLDGLAQQLLAARLDALEPGPEILHALGGAALLGLAILSS